MCSISLVCCLERPKLALFRIAYPGRCSVREVASINTKALPVRFKLWIIFIFAVKVTQAGIQIELGLCQLQCVPLTFFFFFLRSHDFTNTDNGTGELLCSPKAGTGIDISC